MVGGACRVYLPEIRCWERNEVKAIWWIIRTPILITILINFLIFIRILGILVSKLRTHQMRCPDYRLRLARSTLTLVPLLGVHEVVFAPVTEEQARGALRFAKLGFEIFLSSFQVLRQMRGCTLPSSALFHSGARSMILSE
ncbi:Hypothetical predicted protein [Marmota monax]|uniref:G-protein coupled receptors family 2 profile 2 domain-containing protein n=1 Tax=Marmota monax TaxID=9995 RepID=A0A5E4BLN0_MARMO|nr:hypothetical protein GHT09_016324 [Marmota monax]VTJ70477.1 Hypothetical predicted protein [Marmota monax]